MSDSAACFTTLPCELPPVSADAPVRVRPCARGHDVSVRCTLTQLLSVSSCPTMQYCAGKGVKTGVYYSNFV